MFQIYRLDEDGEVVISHEEISASESSKAPEPGRPVKWFDCLHGDEMVWDDVREYDLEEFPETTFRWSAEQLEAVKGSEITPLSIMECPSGAFISVISPETANQSFAPP